MTVGQTFVYLKLFCFLSVASQHLCSEMWWISRFVLFLLRLLCWGLTEDRAQFLHTTVDNRQTKESMTSYVVNHCTVVCKQDKYDTMPASLSANLGRWYCSWCTVTLSLLLRSQGCTSSFSACYISGCVYMHEEPWLLAKPKWPHACWVLEWCSVKSADRMFCSAFGVLPQSSLPGSLSSRAPWWISVTLLEGNLLLTKTGV